MGEVAANASSRTEWVDALAMKAKPLEAILLVRGDHPLSPRAVRADSSPIEGEQR